MIVLHKSLTILANITPFLKDQLTMHQLEREVLDHLFAIIMNSYGLTTFAEHLFNQKYRNCMSYGY
jgi:hypothetical protein